MCGRFALTMDLPELEALFPWVEFSDNHRPRYNVAPSQDILVIPNLIEKKAQMYCWGLIPHWAKDIKIGYKMINARSETLAEKPSFKTAYRKQRCLILADGFYEWKKEASKKTPYYIRLKTTQPFGFAGLWERWQKSPGEFIHSCTIITTDANELVKPIHQRMPVILDNENYQVWLDPDEQAPDRLQHLLKPYPTEMMEAFPVSTVVNSPRNEGPDCQIPLVS